MYVKSVNICKIPSVKTDSDDLNDNLDEFNRYSRFPICRRRMEFIERTDCVKLK